jgi:hypothetical protein
MQFLVFSGAVVGFWFLHIEAARTLGIIGRGEVEDDSFSFIATKILALVAGGYLGGKAAQLLGKGFRILKWPGRVTFTHRDIQVIGPSSKWLLVIETSRPFDIALTSFSDGEELLDAQGKVAKRSFKYFLRIEQDQQHAYLKTTHLTAEALQSIGGIPCSPASSEPQDERVVTFDYKKMKHIAGRFSKLR